ncbi:MAG: Crp/Fnr family transcriptional regulator [Chloroflexaceae bacterium]
MASRQSRLAQQQALWKWLEPYGSVQSFRRHNFIYTPSQTAQSFYLLQSGQVSLQMLSASGRVLTLWVVEAGQVFGHSVLAGSRTYDTFAEAIKPARVVTVPRESVLQALASQPALSLALIEELGQHRLMVSRRLNEVAFKSVPARLASLLLDMADASDVQQIEGQQSRLPHRTHQQLAEMINAYRETVTKVINQFRAADLLDIDRSGITLRNLARLREVAQG